MADKEKDGASTSSSTVANERKKGSSAASTSAQKSNDINTAYNRETDTGIFALGEAASQLENLDEILAGFELNLPDEANKGSPTDTTEESFPPSLTRRLSYGSTTTLTRVVDDVGTSLQGSSIQVSNILKKFPDGRSVQARIIQDQESGKQRLIRVMRETVEGLELLAEFEAPPDWDVNRIVESIPASVLLGKVAIKRRSSNGQYDNWIVDLSSLQTPLPSNNVTRMNAKEVRAARMNGGNKLAMLKRKPDSDELTSLDMDVSTAKPGSKRVSFRKMSTCSDYEVVSEQEGLTKVQRRRCESVTEEDIRRYLPQARLPVVQEDYAATEEEEEDNDHSLCGSCAKIIRGKAIPKGFIKISKGKLCMTASEIPEDDRSFSDPQAVVANYARMLSENRPKFVEMMFRAVKLNKLDVTKVLCKIIQKSGLKLGDDDFRETESSATILHVALLYNHVDIVDFLLNTGDRDLILAKYETKEYHNQTSLHVAVANGNPDLVEKVIKSLELDDQITLINTLADGHYFKVQHPHGQLCLTAAAWAGSGQVIKTIVRYGGNLAMKNLSGNTLLHSIILQAAQHPGRNDYKTLFDSVLDSTAIWAEQMSYESKFAQQVELEKNQMCITLFKNLLNCRNSDGFTPLALAVVKNTKLFNHIINLEKIYKIPQNKLGSISWVTYDVTEITSFARNVYNKFSVLHILAHNSQHLSRHANIDQDEDYMEMEPMKTLLTRKWDVYRWIYILWFVVHLSYMVVFTASTSETNSSCYNLTACEINPPPPVRRGLAMFIILPLFYITLEMLDLFGSKPYRVEYMTGQNYAARLIKGVMSEWTITGNGPYRMVSVGFSCFTIYWFILYVYCDTYQDMGLAMSLLLGWIFVLFFTRGCRVTCRFSIMIQKMFFRDLIYFLTVYAIVLVAFSFAMNIMFEENNISKV